MIDRLIDSLVLVLYMYRWMVVVVAMMRHTPEKEGSRARRPRLECVEGDDPIREEDANAFMSPKEESSISNSIYRFDLMKTEKFRKDSLPVGSESCSCILLLHLFISSASSVGRAFVNSLSFLVGRTILLHFKSLAMSTELLLLRCREDVKTLC